MVIGPRNPGSFCHDNGCCPVKEHYVLVVTFQCGIYVDDLFDFDFREALITNAPAYRSIWLDFDLWRATPEIQHYYLAQLTDFVVNSDKALFNVQRLNKMGEFECWKGAKCGVVFHPMIESNFAFSFWNDFRPQ